MASVSILFISDSLVPEIVYNGRQPSRLGSCSRLLDGFRFKVFRFQSTSTSTSLPTSTPLSKSTSLSTSFIRLQLRHGHSWLVEAQISKHYLLIWQRKTMFLSTIHPLCEHLIRNFTVFLRTLSLWGFSWGENLSRLVHHVTLQSAALWCFRPH